MGIRRISVRCNARTRSHELEGHTIDLLSVISRIETAASNHQIKEMEDKVLDHQIETISKTFKTKESIKQIGKWVERNGKVIQKAGT